MLYAVYQTYTCFYISAKLWLKTRPEVDVAKVDFHTFKLPVMIPHLGDVF